MNLLFLCKHNVFRSKVAEAYFKKINKNKNIRVDSAGFIKADWLNKKDKESIRFERKTLKEMGLPLTSKSRGLSIGLLKYQDLIIILSDDLPNIFKDVEYLKDNLKVRIWEIKDVTYENYKEKTIKKIEEIMRKVEDLVKELKENPKSKKE